MSSVGKNFIYIGIAVLVLIAIFLGYKIYQQSQARQVPPPAQSTPQPTSSSESDVLNFPGPNASDEEKKRFQELVQLYAKETEVLDINKCKPNPLVLKLKDKQEFKVKNDDTILHTIIIDSDHKYPLSPGKISTIKADFGKDPGIYGYTCDTGQLPPVGVFFTFGTEE